ncbi:MAG: hydantoinase B/oxoprolinase family protein [Thiobacillus sp.]|nr:hydantoinase B/oxoprolinase family protein [Thiobacillus sp.]
MATAWEFWVDRGGTFTDIVARAPDGRLIQTKLLSEDPEHYRDAAIAGMGRILGLPPGAPMPAGLVSAVKMGTTVGTNALLTHAGEPTLLIVTEGFADALEIGDQARPDIFALDIHKPEPLYERVEEARERMAADGSELVPLDVPGLKDLLSQGRAQGFQACAIAFLHSWKNPAHELQAGDLARAAGYAQVTLSHQASPLVKFVPRAETAVLDATLSPPVARYVDQVAKALPEDASLEFMQSNGGLAPSSAFRGRDSVLSGPAGGLMGMAKVGRVAGFDRLIGFDMGGTSTDVSLFAGEFERSLDTRIAGHRVRVPMLGVHTVAAGGGSILRFDGTRLLAGPESAGSVPGPRCYRRGGPLAVTDANLLLGRIQADHFPRVFGPRADQSLDGEAVRLAFAELAREVNASLGVDYSPERLAEGFLDIAVEHMADAIRHITLARGVNPADHVLVSFGGAGGQHACAVAQRLGMGRVLISPLASVLSAYGIGLAERRVVSLQAVEQPLRAWGMGNEGWETPPPHPHAGPASARQSVLLRYAGSDTVLPVPRDTPEAMAATFHAEHRRRFGFAAPARELICVALETETVSGGGEPSSVTDMPDSPATPLGKRRVFLAGAWHEAALYASGDLCPGQTVQGPALLVEAGSTVVLEPGWQAERTGRGDLLLSMRAHQVRRPDPSRPDPTWLTLFNRRFMSIAEDMGRVLRNTARSVNIRERLDFSCALFDLDGHLIANAPHIPVHLGSMGDSVRAILTRFGQAMQSGDAYLINSPYAGGTHLPDITVVMPVFGEGGLPDQETCRAAPSVAWPPREAARAHLSSRGPCYFTAARAHHADVGGIAPGSMPAASRHIDEEGCLSDGMLILRDGRFLEAEVRAWLAGNSHPARNPDQNLADLQAQVAACALGAQRLAQLEAEAGAAAVPAYMGFVQDNAEAAVKRLLARLRDGAYTLPLDTLPSPSGGEGTTSGDMQTGLPHPNPFPLGERVQIQVSVRIDREAQRAVIDFTGTSPQMPGNLNAPASIAHSAVLYVFRTLLEEDIPLNAGVLRPLDIQLPEASLLNPAWPAAVVAGNVETSQNIVDALYGALGALAASQGTMNNFSFGDSHHQYYETVCGGSGAGPGFPGASAVQCHMTNSRLTDPEVLEMNFPVRLERFAIRQGSGGPGRFKGGDGVVRRLRFLAPMRANLLALRREIPSFGLDGGGPGKPGLQWIEQADGTRRSLGGVGEFSLEAEDLFHMETPGGGGCGMSDDDKIT